MSHPRRRLNSSESFFPFPIHKLILFSILFHLSGLGHGLSETPLHIQTLCNQTRYPTLCTTSLTQIPDSFTLTQHDLVHISVNMTLNRVSHALYGASEISNTVMHPRVRSAYESCLEMLDDSMDQLSRSLTAMQAGTRADVMTWLSASLTNHDTCMDELDEVSGPVKDLMVEKVKDSTALVSNCLAMFAVSSNGNGKGKDFSGIPIENRRRRLLESGFPEWVRRRERKVLQMPVSAIKPDIIVSKDGNGTYKKISEAIKAAPEFSNRRIVIYVKAGRYEENNLKVGRKKTNLMFVGDGKGLTIISGGKSVQDNVTTFHTAAFAATGAGFMARDITFENWAGPAKHQAVALRVGADHAVVYRCNIIGYQDTLYVHSNRQFFRECDIYGTVDFIFGNAAVVLQNCSIHARKPMDLQKNTITAQNRKDPHQVTGISIHNCRILATEDLQASKASFPTYLGRPWKLYSRTVYMQSYIGDHVHPRGWLEWNATFALDTLYYGEYQNYGPGGALAQRVKWPGYRVITLAEEANKFSVAQFIFGSSWLPSTGVTFTAGLSL